MRRAILALAAACESLGLRAMDAGLRIVDAAAWVRDHVDPKRHGHAAVNERERADADREAFDRFMARADVIIPPPPDFARLDRERGPVRVPPRPMRTKRVPFGFN